MIVWTKVPETQEDGGLWLKPEIKELVLAKRKTISLSDTVNRSTWKQTEIFISRDGGIKKAQLG